MRPPPGDAPLHAPGNRERCQQKGRLHGPRPYTIPTGPSFEQKSAGTAQWPKTDLQAEAGPALYEEAPEKGSQGHPPSDFQKSGRWQEPARRPGALLFPGRPGRTPLLFGVHGHGHPLPLHLGPVRYRVADRFDLVDHPEWADAEGAE